MRKLILILLALMLVGSALAESDLAAMSTDELIALRNSIDDELAKREQHTDQIVDVDGLQFSIDSVYIGTGRDDAPAICILFSASNTSDKSFTPLFDIGCDIIQDGVVLQTTYFNSDIYTGPSVSASNNAVIAPGTQNMKICEAGLLTSDSEHFTVNLSKRHFPAGEDPYCGTFDFNLSDYIDD